LPEQHIEEVCPPIKESDREEDTEEESREDSEQEKKRKPTKTQESRKKRNKYKFVKQSEEPSQTSQSSQINQINQINQNNRIIGLPWSDNSCHIDTLVEVFYWSIDRDESLLSMDVNQVNALDSADNYDVERPFATFINTFCNLRHNMTLLPEKRRKELRQSIRQVYCNTYHVPIEISEMGWIMEWLISFRESTECGTEIGVIQTTACKDCTFEEIKTTPVLTAFVTQQEGFSLDSLLNETHGCSLCRSSNTWIPHMTTPKILTVEVAINSLHLTTTAPIRLDGTLKTHGATYLPTGVTHYKDRHFTAHVNTNDGWYYYNDLRTYLTKTSMPKTITNGSLVFFKKLVE